MVQLKKLTAAGKLTKVKNSFKLSSGSPKPASAKHASAQGAKQLINYSCQMSRRTVSNRFPLLKPKEPKEKPCAPRSHPPYVEMISEAITSLKERTGSSP